jgi:hypothetical protein
MGFKRLILITICLLGSKAQLTACGFYPRAEELRYNFLKPEYIFPKSGDYYFYNMNLYSYPDETADVSNMFEDNCMLWMDALNDRFLYEDVYNAIYVATEKELRDPATNNGAIRALQSEQFKAHLNYLIFAKSISYLNGDNYDEAWEYVGEAYMKKRNKAISKALKLANKEQNEQLKRRYAHLAIRLAYYNGNEEKVRSVYSKYFTEGAFKDAIDYWALYFKLGFESYTPEVILKYTQIFLHSKEKRPAIGQMIYDSFGYETLNEIAKTDDERIAVNFFAGCTNQYFSMDYMDAIAQIDPSHPCLDFLALRELNKVEHKTMTTNYLNFHGTQWEYYGDDQDDEASVLRNTIDNARENSLFLGEFMESIADKRKTNSWWWSVMAEYSKYLSRSAEMNTHSILEQSKKSGISAEQRMFLEEFYLLALYGQDEDPELTNKDARALLLKPEHYGNAKLLIAIAKELEQHDHPNQSSVVFSIVNQYTSDYDSYGIWRNNQFTTTLDMDFYTDYFQYLDATRSAYEIQQLIHFLDKFTIKDDFDRLFYDRIKLESNRLYDMLGTKYVRKDDLKSAYSALLKVNDTLWKSENYAYRQYIREDPFNNDFYWKTDYRHSKELGKNYTKPEILKELMSLIDEVNKSSGSKKAKAAFRVANCYRNMSYYGNAWMMRRYFWSAYPSQRGFEDDEEYYYCQKAQHYYKIAAENATTEEFEVLALNMAGKCYQYEMIRDIDQYYVSDYDLEKLDKLNPIYKQIYKNHSDYEHTIGNCYGYQTMFKSMDK